MPRSEIAKAAAVRRVSVQSRTYQHMDDPAAGGHQDADGKNEAEVAVKFADDFFHGVGKNEAGATVGSPPLFG